MASSWNFAVSLLHVQPVQPLRLTISQLCCSNSSFSWLQLCDIMVAIPNRLLSSTYLLLLAILVAVAVPIGPGIRSWTVTSDHRPCTGHESETYDAPGKHVQHQRPFLCYRNRFPLTLQLLSKSACSDLWIPKVVCPSLIIAQRHSNSCSLTDAKCM